MDDICFMACGIIYPIGEALYYDYAYCAVCLECYSDCDGASSGC